MRWKSIQIMASLAISATAFYSGTGLEGWWWLTWLAPLPVLIMSFQMSGRGAAGLAFAAYGLGGLNMLSYLLELVPPPVAALAIVTPAMVFCLSVLAARYTLRRWPSWFAPLIFPAAWTSYEYVQSIFSPHGTFGSLAYTQLDFLPLVQIASITGFTGISFLVMLFPAGLAAAWHWRKNPRLAWPALGLAAGLCLLAAGSGLIRLAGPPPADTVNAGIAVTDTSIDSFRTENQQVTRAVLQAYANRIATLAGQGARLVVLPEKLTGVVPAGESEAFTLLGETARLHGVTIVAGLNRVGREPLRNSALVFGPDGQLIASYDKARLVPGWESGYLPGRTPGRFTSGGVPWGVAICKDMDFPGWLRQYAGVRIVAVPAWDFIRDGRLHSRMAILRGIEMGFSVVRAARQGRLTINDHLGRLLADESSAKAAEVLVSATVTLGPGSTWYSRTGDWWALVWLALLVVIPGRAFWRPSPLRSSEETGGPAATGRR